MVVQEDFYFNGLHDELRKLYLLNSSTFKTVEIQNLTYDQQGLRIFKLTCESLILENCICKRYLRLEECKVLSLDIRNSNFEDVLSFGRGSQIDQIYLNKVGIYKSLDSYSSFTHFNCYELFTKRLRLLNKKGIVGVNVEEVYIYLQDNKIEEVDISVVDRIIEVELKNNRIKAFRVNETRELTCIIQDDNEFEKAFFYDISDLKFNGLYESPIDKLVLTNCGISQLTDYGERGDDNYFEENRVGEIHLKDCTTLKKSSLEVPRPLKLYLEECKFDKPLLIKSVYKRIHVTLSSLTIGEKNSGDILIEHVNMNLNFTGTNFSNITIKASGINALAFDTFANHGKINFINSMSSIEEFIKASNYTNYLTAVDSILDNINFHFFDLNSFKHIQLINTNILGMQLFYYPVRLAVYSENLNILPCLADERDFNINARFTYNQFRLLAERNGDTDRSVEYRSLEQNYLRRTKNNIADEMLLFLNEVSNWHGRNWLLGVFFTLITGLISFAAYQGSMRIFIFSDFNWPAEFIRYIATYPKLQLPGYDTNANFITDLARLFGIVLMGYGIFQTISAFRKYGKK